MAIDIERLKFAEEVIRMHPDRVQAESIKGILEQQVTVGMTPYEAKLACGPYRYRVQPDLKKWPPGQNPLTVIDKQSVDPDDSRIWLTFETRTQFPGEGLNRFEVHFFRGRALSIRKLGAVGEATPSGARV